MKIRTKYQSLIDARFDRMIARTWTTALLAYLVIWIVGYQL